MTIDVQCDGCARTAIYVVMIQDLIKEKDGIQDPVKFMCMEHTVKRVSVCLSVPGRYSITIDPTGAKQRATTRKKGNRHNQDDDSIAAEVNRFS